jgi:hypothetical protein
MLVEAIIAGLLALAVVASLRAGKTVASGEWRIPYLASRSKNPFDFWFTVLLLGTVAGVLAIYVAINDAAALLAPTIGAVVVFGAFEAVPKSAWRAVGEFFTGPPAKPAVNAKAHRAVKRSASVAVRGWAPAELQRIVADFSASYELPDAAIELGDPAGEISTLAVSDEVSPETLCFLVNYLNYPKGFDLRRRSIGVLARTAMPAGFGKPDLVGKAALIYVPSDDAGYDQVYVHCAEQNYVVPFTNFRWRPTASARMPATISDL